MYGTACTFQAGTQRRNVDNFKFAANLAHTGKLGKIHTVHAGILKLEERPRPRLFCRRDRFDRFVSAFVFVPRDRFSTDVRIKVGELLAEKMRHDDAYERALQDWLHRERTWSSDGAPYPGRELL